MTTLNTLSSYGIPTHSSIIATRFALTTDESITPQIQGMGSLTKGEYETRIAEVLGLNENPTFENEDVARICFGYTVQETIRSSVDNVTLDLNELWNKVQQKTNDFVRENPYIFSRDEESQPKRSSTVSKKELALKMWNETDNPTSVSRKEWIGRFVSELGLTEAGSSTYHANLKSGRWV